MWYFEGENMSTDQNKLKSFCKYNYKLIDCYVGILDYYKSAKNFENDENVLDENEKEVKPIVVIFFSQSIVFFL
jgi:hypothetical protein